MTNFRFKSSREFKWKLENNQTVENHFIFTIFYDFFKLIFFSDYGIDNTILNDLQLLSNCQLCYKAF